MMKERLGLLFLAALAVVLLLGHSDAATPTVGPGGAYATIQAAVNAGVANITVAAGTYDEMVVPKSNTTIQDFGNGPVILDRHCAASYGFYVAGVSNVVIRDMTVTGTRDASVMISEGASSVTVDHMTLQNFDCAYTGQDPSSWGQYRSGVASWYGGAHIWVTNNTIAYRTSGEVRGSADPIWFKSNDNNPSGGGHYIANNTIIGGWDGIGGEEEGSAHGSFDKNTTIENNTISSAWDDCIQVEGGDTNVRVRSNDLSGCGVGVAFAAPMAGPLYIEGNRIHDLVTGLYDSHVCYKVGTNGSSSAVTYLTGNSCDVRGGDEANGIHQSGGDNMTPIVARGNFYHVDGYAFYVQDTRGQDYQCDTFEKVYAVTDNFSKWQGVYDSTLQAFQARTGQETAEDCGLPVPTKTPSPTPTRSPTATPTASPTPKPPTATPTPVNNRCRIPYQQYVNGRWGGTKYVEIPCSSLPNLGR